MRCIDRGGTSTVQQSRFLGEWLRPELMSNLLIYHSQRLRGRRTAEGGLPNDISSSATLRGAAGVTTLMHQAVKLDNAEVAAATLKQLRQVGAKTDRHR